MKIAACAVMACILAGGPPLLGQASSQPAAAWEPQRSGLPSTPAGGVAGAYIKAFNGGEAAIREFESKFRSAAALKERSVEDRVKAYRDLKQQWGELSLHGLLDVSGDSLTVLLRTLPGNGWMVAEFQCEAPGVLKAIQLEGPMDESEARERFTPVDAETRDQTIKAIAHQLRQNYVFPDVAERMGSMLEKNAADGKYDKITGGPDLARTLTEDLRGICHDKHLRVRPAPGPNASMPGQPSAAEEGSRNFGFSKTEVLAGNVGYIKFDAFSASDDARNAAAAAMAKVADCRALVFDLRENGGGSPRMIEFLGGYLYETPTVLNRFLDRKGRKVSQTTTLAEVPGKKTNAPVYVLTSGRTFSCAEEFSYDLQKSGRGVVVGETTGGGAHPVRGVPLNDRFVMMVPYERAENPISHDNWEGKGVVPDIKAPVSEALEAALSDWAKQSSAKPH